MKIRSKFNGDSLLVRLIESRFGGSQSALARYLGIERQAVRLWLRAGCVPIVRAQELSEASCGEISISDFLDEIHRVKVGMIGSKNAN